MSGAIKRSVLIAGHRTSISLEPEFWDALKEVAASKGRSINGLITDIDRDRTTNLSSALRVYLLKHQRGGSAAHETATGDPDR